MSIDKATRLSKIAREFNIGITTIVDYLHAKGEKIDSNPNTKISSEQYEMVLKEFSSDLTIKKESEKVDLRSLREKRETISIDEIEHQNTPQVAETPEPKTIVSTNIFEPVAKPEEKIKLNIIGKIDLNPKPKTKPQQEEIKPAPEKQVVEKPKATPVEPKATPVEPVVEPEIEVVKEPVKQIAEPVIEEAPSPKIFVNEATKSEEPQVKVVGRIDLDAMNQRTRPAKKTKAEKEEQRRIEKNERKQPNTPPKQIETSAEATPIKDSANSPKVVVVPAHEVNEVIRVNVKKLNGPTVLGKMELPVDEKKGNDRSAEDRKKKRKRINKDKVQIDKSKDYKPAAATPEADKNKKKVFINSTAGGGFKKGGGRKPDVNEEDVQKQIKDTLARLTSKGAKSKGSKYRREKRDLVSQRLQDEERKSEEEKNIIKVTEFVTVAELASLMDAQVTEIISTCMSLGLFVSINQRLDAETMALVADEFGFKVEFVSVEVQEAIREEEDNPEDLIPRPPIVTVMGHVDHGKTRLLDYVRNANVIAGEAGGITQHIGAYLVGLADGRKITFLDTPGHEAFTAMRARGAQVTDCAIIVIAADDGIKPQTVEAINHAQAAGVPMIFAINKIDKASANPEKVKEELANMNILVEDWGGKYQSQEISAKDGLNVGDLLEKVLLEAEMLDLKANPAKPATGTIVESSLDKGRGYVATILVQNGTLRVGDIMLAGTHHGKIRAMYNERNQIVKEAGPSTPVLVLGLSGAPQAGDRFNIINSEREAREIANKREQLQREQGLRTQKHITLDEIGRRIAIGNFQELNVIVKGDVDGSIEALTDSLIKLSTSEIQVNIIHKAVGQISEGDVLLAAASNAIIVGFQVRPSTSARKLAEKEEIDIRLYSIIYDAIDEIRSAMEGMLSPELRENIVASLEVLEAFNITKVGTIAGCMVKEGKVKRNSKVRLIRDGIVIYTGELGSLKRFKDDAKEVVVGLECGLNLKNFNDIKAGDFIEAFEEYEVKKTL